MPLTPTSDLGGINDSDRRRQVAPASGRILDASGRPLHGAQVEIWQVDRNGVYLHSEGGDREQRDAGFQGYGRCITGKNGEYTFRTVKPVPYASRTSHIHFGVRRPGSSERFTTQMYVKGEPLNARDGLLNAIEDRHARDSVIVDFQPLAAGSGELTARFDIVLGATPGA